MADMQSATAEIRRGKR